MNKLKDILTDISYKLRDILTDIIDIVVFLVFGLLIPIIGGYLTTVIAFYPITNVIFGFENLTSFGRTFVFVGMVIITALIIFGVIFAVDYYFSFVAGKSESVEIPEPIITENHVELAGELINKPDRPQPEKISETVMLRCQVCKNISDDGSIFCTTCGSELSLIKSSNMSWDDNEDLDEENLTITEEHVEMALKNLQDSSIMSERDRVDIKRTIEYMDLWGLSKDKKKLVMKYANQKDISYKDARHELGLNKNEIK